MSYARAHKPGSMMHLSLLTFYFRSQDETDSSCGGDFCMRSEKEQLT